jgi:hypothetical protein
LQTEIRTGVSDGDWIEITQRRVKTSPGASSSQEAWVPIDGSEQVILGDLSILVDGGPVKVITEKPQGAAAEATPARTVRPGETASDIASTGPEPSRS